MNRGTRVNNDLRIAERHARKRAFREKAVAFVRVCCADTPPLRRPTEERMLAAAEEITKKFRFIWWEP